MQRELVPAEIRSSETENQHVSLSICVVITPVHAVQYFQRPAGNSVAHSEIAGIKEVVTSV